MKIVINDIKKAILQNRKKDDGRYARIVYNFVDTDNDITFEGRTNMSKEQWFELKEGFGIITKSVHDKIQMPNFITLEFDEKGKTTGKTPKPLFDRHNDTFEGFEYDYYEISTAVFIANGVLSPSEFSAISEELL